MNKEGGFGDGSFHLVNCVEHLLVDGELLCGGGQGVGQGVDYVGKAGKETAIKITDTE